MPLVETRTSFKTCVVYSVAAPVCSLQFVLRSVYSGVSAPEHMLVFSGVYAPEYILRTHTLEYVAHVT